MEGGHHSSQVGFDSLQPHPAPRFLCVLCVGERLASSLLRSASSAQDSSLLKPQAEINSFSTLLLVMAFHGSDGRVTSTKTTVLQMGSSSQCGCLRTGLSENGMMLLVDNFPLPRPLSWELISNVVTSGLSR